jgi:opacity protein-like surface antigen
MKKIILLLSFLILLFIQNISAQGKISFSLGAGYVPSVIDKTKLPYWDNGYVMNFSSYYNFTEEVGLFFSSSYQKNYVDENLITFPVAQVVGYRYSIHSENSSVFEFSVGSIIYANNSRIRPYLSLGAGLLLIEQGKIEITDWMDGDPNRTTSLYSNTGKSYNLSQFNLGVGLEIALINNLRLVFGGRLIYSVKGPTYFPIATSIRFGL